MMAAVPAQEVVDPVFLYYLLIEAKLFQFAGGSALPFLRQSDLNEIEVKVPALPEQRRIAGVLTAIDHKAAHARETGNRCRQVCSQLFEQSFGHGWAAAFHAGRSPRGGNWGTLADIAALRYGKALKASERRGGHVSVVGSSGVVGQHDEAVTQGPAVVVGRKGTAGSVLWIGDPVWPIDTTFYATPTEGISLEYVYYALRAADLPHLTSDSAVPGLNRDAALDRAVVVPKSDDATSFTSAARPLLSLATTCDREAARLSDIRDALIPKLVSGRLRVAEDYLADAEEPVAV